MLAAIRSDAVVGIDAYDVLVEVHAARGLPVWTIVGLPAGAVKESRDRVSAAIVNSGCVVPYLRVTINLAPAKFTHNHHGTRGGARRCCAAPRYAPAPLNR